jgi:hypothetical protein
MSSRAFALFVWDWGGLFLASMAYEAPVQHPPSNRLRDSVQSQRERCWINTGDLTGAALGLAILFDYTRDWGKDSSFCQYLAR